MLPAVFWRIMLHVSSNRSSCDGTAESQRWRCSHKLADDGVVGDGWGRVRITWQVCPVPRQIAAA